VEYLGRRQHQKAIDAASRSGYRTWHDTLPIPWVFDATGFYYARSSDPWRLNYFDFSAHSSRLEFTLPRGNIRSLSIGEQDILYDLEVLQGIDIRVLDGFDRGLE
jgi:hypothetical protein